MRPQPDDPRHAGGSGSSTSGRGRAHSWTATLTTAGRSFSTSLPAGPPGTGKLDFPVDTVPGDGAAPGRFCVRALGEGAAFGGTQGLQGNDVPLTVGGSPVEARVALWYLPPVGERRSLLSALPDIARRAALFRPGWVGSWTYWMLLCLVTPALGYAALRLLTGGAGRRATAIAIGAFAFVNGAAFATLSPAFQAPDETEHMAYVQMLGETGSRPTLVPGRGAYSSEENLALEATRPLTRTRRSEGRPPWLAIDEQPGGRLRSARRRWAATTAAALPPRPRTAPGTT